jgi:hypothetical protein
VFGVLQPFRHAAARKNSQLLLLLAFSGAS